MNLSKCVFLRPHFVILSFTGLLIAHVVAFGCLFLFGGSWITSKVHVSNTDSVAVEDA